MNRKLAWMGGCFAFAQFAVAWRPLAALLLLGAGAAALWSRKQGRPRQAGFCFALILVTLVSLLWQQVYTNRAEKMVRTWEGQEVTVTATVRSAQPAYEGYSYGLLHLEEINGRKISCNITCYGFPETRPGQSFQAKFELTALEPDDYENWAEGAAGEGEYRGGYQTLGPGPGILAWFGRLQQRLAENLSGVLPQETVGVASAMILGEKGKLEGETRTAFARAGCSHILVVSGLHLTLLCQAVAGTFRLGRFSRFRACLSILIALVMMGLVGMTPSVCRSAITLIFFSAGHLVFLKPDSLTLLSLAGMVLCVQNPYAAFDIGFQLSFGATYCVLFAAWLRPRVLQFPALKEKYRKNPLLRKGETLFCQILDALFTGLMAGLGTLPLLLFHRMSVSAASPFSSVLATLLGPWVLGLGMALALLTLIPWTAFLWQPLGWAVGGFISLLCEGVRFLSTLGIARLSLPREYGIFVLAVLAAMALVMVKWGYLKHLLLSGALLLAAACLVGTLAGRDVVELQLTGTAGYPVVVLTQNGQAAVVFRGGNANRSALTRALEARGIDQPAQLIDLRLDAQTQPPEADQVIRPQENTTLTGTLLDGVEYCLVAEEDGLLLVLDIQGSRVAVTAGTLEENRQVPVDLYLAGSKLAIQIQPDAILAVGTKLNWLTQTELPVYTGSYPGAAVRPGGGIQIKGGTLYDIQ